MLMDEDNLIFQRIKIEIQKNFPRDDDNYLDNNYIPNKKDNYSYKYSSVILDTEKNIITITNLKKRINNDKLNSILDDIIKTLNSMISYCKINEEGNKKLERINEYHLPTSIKMLNSYIDFSDLPIKNENIEKTVLEIENVIMDLNKALKNMLIEMNQNKLIDINSDIDVLKNILEKDGI